MIALVITIIVIIILAAIVMVASTNTIGSANYAKFAHELSEIQDKVTVKRNENQVDGPGEEFHNQGFKKVTIENAPSNFVSFDDGETTGYWVQFDTIQEKDIKTGREELTTDEVRFGKNDVYVYDAEGKVYYAKGWLDENEELHYRIDTKAEETENPDVALPNLTASYTLSADKTSATVTIVAGAVNGGTLTVTVDGTTPAQIGQNTYEYVVNENGKLTIVASESGGGSRTRTLTIEGIRIPDVTPPEITSLTGDASATSVVIRGTAQDTESNIVGYKFTDGNSEPTEWITVNASSISPSYTATADGTYYFWVKNEDGLVSSQSITVALKKIYTITYNANGGTLGEVPSTQEKIEDENAKLSTKLPTREGYNFKGWGTSASSISPSYQVGATYVVDANIELYAVWEAKTYTIKYNANGGSLGSVPSSELKTYNKTYTINANSPTREGYTFEGWGTSSSSTTSTYQPGGTYTTDANLELYAVWEINKYIVTYNANGGSLGSVASTQTKTHNQNLTLDSNSPTRDGYAFQGWTTSSNSTTAAYQPNGTYTDNANVTLYAVWKANTYTVTYNANGGSLGSVASTQAKTHDQNLTLNSNSPSREGYTFQGWATSASSTIAVYQPNGTYTGNADIELFAIWKANTYTVTYNANGGSLGSVPSTQTKTHGQNLTLDINSPTRAMYVFQGWGTTASSTTVAYNAGGTYTGNADIELFAIWKLADNVVNVDGLGNVEVSDPDMELTYDPNAGTLGGAVPPSENEPETPAEIPEEELPEIIEFGFGNFKSNTTYIPGTYETVSYENTYTRTKYPVSYQNIIWSEWLITKDENGNVTKTEPGDMILADIGEQYSTYIVYDFETDEALESNGVKGDSVELWTIYNTSEDTLENAVYMAAYIRKAESKTTLHIAKWDGSKYVEYDADTDIEAIDSFIETYTVTETKNVQISAPSTSTEYVYVPVGTMKAEAGMTWSEWLESDYNTTGETTPAIKTLDFEDVAYTDTIVADNNYGFVVYELSGTWLFNDRSGIVLPESSQLITQAITFEVHGSTFNSIKYTDGWGIFYDSENVFDGGDWMLDELRTVNFGTEAQEVSKEFYEWFTANATKIMIIPDGGLYYQQAFENWASNSTSGCEVTHNAGDTFPAPQMGDVYEYNGYRYVYNMKWDYAEWDNCESYNGWAVMYIDSSATSVAIMETEIAGKPIVDLCWTFYSCDVISLPEGFVIPNTVTRMDRFATGSALQILPSTFRIPASVDNLNYAFGHTKLTGELRIDANPSTYYNCFYEVDFLNQNLVLTGESTMLAELGATGTNYQG